MSGGGRARPSYVTELECALCDFYWAAKDRGLGVCDGWERTGSHGNWLGTFSAQNCPLCLARRLYDREDDGNECTHGFCPPEKCPNGCAPPSAA